MEKKVRWGVLGNAWIARDFMIPALERSEICELAAVASRSSFPADIAPNATHYNSYKRAWNFFIDIRPYNENCKTNNTYNNRFYVYCSYILKKNLKLFDCFNRIALIVLVQELCNGFGIGFTFKAVALADKKSFQLTVIFDDTVVYN